MNGTTDVQEPLQGIQSQVDLPEGPQQPIDTGEGDTANVRLEYYGRNFGEMNHDANYGPDETELHDHHVAISPDTAKQLGLSLGDWVWVGPQLRQYMDHSYVSPGRPTSGTVEVRDYPADGRTTLRKASPDEISSMQASMLTGMSPENITAEDVNQAIQGVPERALIAGEPTQASYEAATQPDFTQPADVPSGMDVAASGDMNGMMAGGGGDIVTGDFATPNPAHSKLTRTLPDGTREFDNGAVKYHPNTDTLEWTVAGRTFIKTGQYGKVTSFPSAKIVRNPDTGEYYNMASGSPVKVQLPGQSPAFDPNLSSEANLKRLSPQDRSTVDLFSNYQLPMTTRFGRMNPEFARLRGYIMAANPHIDPRNYQIQQQTMQQYASGQNGSPGQRINSSNQALVHGGTLWDMAKRLPEGNFPKGNTVLNYINTNIGSSAATNFEQQLQLFATEVSRAAKGGVPDSGEINEIMKRVNASGSKAQIEGTIKDVFAQYLEGIMETANFGYRRNMHVDYTDLISPDGANALGKMGLHQFAHRDLTPMQSGGTQDAARQAAIEALTQAGRLVNETTIKEAMRRMQPTR